jgi:hypothetical protein
VISIPSALIGAVVLLLLILVWIRSASVSQHSSSLWSPPPEEIEAGEPCPLEFVSRIFSGEDLGFISRLESSYLERLFRRERNAVAQLWVRQISAAISQILREHLEASRQSHDLEFRTEAAIFLRYTELKLICAVLSASIELVGPQRLRGLALHASKLTQSIGDAHRAFAFATQTREAGGAGSR